MGSLNFHQHVQIFSPMGEIFLLCHLPIYTCLCDTGFSAQVLRVSWNSSHATMDWKANTSSLENSRKKEEKKKDFFFMLEQFALFFSEQQQRHLCPFQKFITVPSHVLSVSKM